MEPLVVYDKTARWQKRILYGLGGILGLAILLTGLQFTGLLAAERHSGFFAPTWDINGEQVFYIQRDTVGISWGLGWKDVSPPAYAFVVNDQISLRRLYLKDGRVEILRSLEKTPASGRVLRNYRGRIFSPLLARINVRDGGLDFMAQVVVQDEAGSDQGFPLSMIHPGGYSDNPMAGDLELIALPGRESYPAAVLAVSADGDYDVLLQNRYFSRLYPEPMPPAKLQQWSRRQNIEEERALQRRAAELVKEYRQRGMGDAEIESALIGKGYIPVTARLIASRINVPAPEDRQFNISDAEFAGGLFEDIRQAIEQPGIAVVKQQADYIAHQNYDAGQELNEWLAAGNRSFVIRYQGRYYRLLLVY